jgi:7-keto-8-aminopelargonate synthetase-like enzyme
MPAGRRACATSDHCSDLEKRFPNFILRVYLPAAAAAAATAELIMARSKHEDRK